MIKSSKQLSNPYSTGSGGPHFEAHVQASFVILMLTGGFAPCLPCWPICEIKLQGKVDGFDTDDLIVFVDKPGGGQKRKILGQIKHSIRISQDDKIFGEVIQAAWNDFNNPAIFTKSKDIIALITGPLSATDTKDVCWLLDQARHTKSADEFFRNVERANFSSEQKRNKLTVFQTQLKKANNNKDVPKQEVYLFLNHFHLLGYDLGREMGVVLSLLHSHISQFNSENPQWVWSRVVDIVQTWNQDAGTIVIEKIPEDLRDAFKQQVYETIPNELSLIQSTVAKPDWDQIIYASDLAVVILLGLWNEKNEADIEIVRQLVHDDYGSWISNLREILQQPESPLSLKNGMWRVTERKTMWKAMGARLFDNDLDIFKECVVTALKERDPQFDLAVDERFVASIHGKVLTHSLELREGMAESLALLGTQPDALTNCSLNKPETIAVLAVREIFNKADWTLWGSLNSLLPILAEAAPDEFLNVVENALQQTPCPFDELFSQEGNGLTGGNYITGLLWALETLAWDEKFLVRTCVILGDLASHDPGGNSSNRPANSITTILLPWLPQTTASIGKRKVAIKTLQKECPAVAWKTLLSLLPNQHQMSIGTRKPVWRNTIPEDWKKGVGQQEYWDQVSYCAELAVQMAYQSIEKLNDFINYLDDLPEPFYRKILEYLSSDEVSSKPENERIVTWTKLTEIVTKHRRFPDAKWAMSSDMVSEIEAVAAKLAPNNPLNLYRRLFSSRELDLFEEKGNWDEQHQKLENRRQQAVKDILAYGGVDAVIQFSGSVESPSNVGNSLGNIAGAENDAAILPILLDSENKKLVQFASGYIRSRQNQLAWTWVDGLDKSGWSVTQVAQFLSYLPFERETWIRSATWLGESDGEYWKRTNTNPYRSNCDLGVAIDKLIEYGRPVAAIACLNRMLYEKQPLDRPRSVKALLAAVTSTETSDVADAYDIVEIIKALQNDFDTDPEDLFRVEWAYLPLLDQNHDASPKFLENRLASDPAFFCEVIRLIYRSKKDNEPKKEQSKQNRSIATNAWTLLERWRTPPGIQPNGSFSDQKFTEWLEHTKSNSAESGHLEVALTHVGQVLFYSSPDPNGLWINQAAAEALNAKDAEDMRSGFHLEAYNSRGVHWVDPTGQPERELANQFKQMADEVENAGYQRFAATIRNLSESYDREADRIVAENSGLAASDD